MKIALLELLFYRGGAYGFAARVVFRGVGYGHIFLGNSDVFLLLLLLPYSRRNKHVKCCGIMCVPLPRASALLTWSLGVAGQTFCRVFEVFSAFKISFAVNKNKKSKFTKSYEGEVYLSFGKMWTGGGDRHRRRHDIKYEMLIGRLNVVYSNYSCDVIAFDLSLGNQCNDCIFL